MRPLPTASIRPLRAPHHAGALLLLAVSLLLTACGDKEDKVPDWKADGKVPAGTTADPPPANPEPTPGPGPAVAPESLPPDTPDPVAEPSPAPVTPDASPSAPGDADAAPELRFVSYNLKNYLTMVNYVDGERREVRKPEEEIAAVVRIIVSADPDVLGLCEIGTPEDLAELQQRLGDAGLSLPHHTHAGGADDVRHLALLSRHPIVATNSQGADGNLPYKSVDLQGDPKQFAMQRGILDATVETDGKQVRFLGVHLKSKREVPEGHQDLMRRNEAYLLRQHASRILQSAPDTLLCVYGDCNDYRREPPVRSISGDAKSGLYLEPLSHKDSRGEVWTHYWDYQHVYSRLDYVFASRALRPLQDQKRSRIIDDPDWREASDHRPLLTVFKWN